MEEYVVERTMKRRKSEVTTLVIVILAVCLIYVPIELFDDINKLVIVFLSVLRIFGIIIIPLLIRELITAIKDLRNDKPYLIIRKDGLIQNMSEYQSELIPWEDIQDIKISRPEEEGAYSIYIYLKNPEKHIKSEKLLKKLKTQKGKFSWASILTIHTHYFKDEGKKVVSLIQKYYGYSKTKPKTEQAWKNT